MERVIPNLLGGKSLTYIERTSEAETKELSEDYKQIELDIDGCRDLYDAFEQRCKVVKGEHKVRILSKMHPL